MGSFMEQVKFFHPPPKEVTDPNSNYGFGVRTAPSSRYFGAKNQAKRCFSAYTVAWVLADNGMLLTDRGRKTVDVLHQYCPNEWIEGWDDARLKERHTGYTGKSGKLSLEAENLEEAMAMERSRLVPELEDKEIVSMDDADEALDEIMSKIGKN
eukprot:CAMPEP_0119148172 /NCGR_PEP_ID=MMETSP1310-20130426/41456_1 /TAXON_ID=464262 /ORGANISM="Genus nov. species nov., Strain RCC2339" /LENGTH=153 /DNA_ID=CAMNT_0007140193 /DNA_START=131 /DNA_END=592 /DNA_ORIENTATION=+